MSDTTKSVTGDILLEAGTNELEVLVFRMGEGFFGVNVAKVREVIKPVPTYQTPGQHPSVIGMFNIRGQVMPVVDLARHLRVTRQQQGEGRIIITEFNGVRCGFLVDGVEQIHRMSWQRVRPTPALEGLSTTQPEVLNGSTTGVIEMDKRLILMIDFESVADSILMQKKLHVDKVDNPDNIDRASKRVIMAEDSPFMRDLMRKVLINSGYVKLEVYHDGQAAWEALQKPGESVAAVVSDIEMPRVDGLHLTSKIKNDPRLKDIPVVLFSSLISEDNRKKGLQVGADVQIPKPELPDVVRLVDNAVSGKLTNQSKAA